ncbi:MAG TPA: NADH-quinone oxidoreductase subunit J [Nitrolancea sp.]|nr:NADH-quinone oxidoreductase subunit J [Nitrolancea sp.]
MIGFGALALWFGVAVFRTSSMVRSALALLFAMAALGGLFLALEAEFLGVLQLMMMATEMAIMAIFMVMYMMDPGGLGQMEMTHQKRRALAAGTLGGLVSAALSLLTGWGPLTRAAPDPVAQVHDLGRELLERSMLIFETAGVTILVAMVAATAVAIGRRA